MKNNECSFGIQCGSGSGCSVIIFATMTAASAGSVMLQEIIEKNPQRHNKLSVYHQAGEGGGERHKHCGVHVVIL